MASLGLLVLVFVVVAVAIGGAVKSSTSSGSPAQPARDSVAINKVREELKALPLTGLAREANRRAVLQKELHRLGGDPPTPTPARDRVQNEGWHGEVYQVESYLKHTLKDPDSYQGIEWGKVSKAPNGFLVEHRYRAKNSFGGYVIEQRVFTLDLAGNVTGTIP